MWRPRRPPDGVTGMVPPDIVFTLDSRQRAREALASLAAAFPTRRERRSLTRVAYYDTFDWRLHRDGFALASERQRGGVRLDWRALDGGPRHSWRLDEVPGFAWDLPPGAASSALAEVIEVRRLLPVARIERRLENLAVLDGLDKTVVRVRVERGRATPGDEGEAPHPLRERLRVSAVLGYDDAQRAVAERLAELPGLERSAEDELELALDALGVEPKAHGLKLELDLDPASPADAAAREVLRGLFGVLSANEAGVREDIDTEFLHDFRVSIRRMRACLGQMKHAFGRPAIEGLRDELAWLGRAAGPTRDLDVYLLELRRRRTRLPPSVASGLVTLERHLGRRRTAERRRLVHALASARYAKLLRARDEFLEHPAPPGPEGARPVREVAAARIERAFRRVREVVARLDDGQAETELHRARIECKKLRYLLEFFGALLDPERVGPLVRSLKTLQDRLGAFNDLTVQRRELRASALSLARGRAKSTDTLLSIGYLLGTVELEQERLRGPLVSALREFVDDQAAHLEGLS